MQILNSHRSLVRETYSPVPHLSMRKPYLNQETFFERASVGNRSRRNQLSSCVGIGVRVGRLSNCLIEVISLDHLPGNVDFHNLHPGGRVCGFRGGLWQSRSGPRIVGVVELCFTGLERHLQDGRA